MRVTRVAALLAAAGVAASCSSSAPAPIPTPSPTASRPSTSPATPSAAALSTSTLRCSDAIGDGPPTADMLLIPGIAGIPSTRQPALQAGRTGDAGPVRLFAKVGLLVHTGAAFVITVAQPAHAAIGWGNPAQPAPRFVVPGCPPRPGSTTGWLAFAGGFFVDKPGCISLTLASGTRLLAFRVGVGVPCPGQQPAPAPNQT